MAPVDIPLKVGGELGCERFIEPPRPLSPHRFDDPDTGKTSVFGPAAVPLKVF